MISTSSNSELVSIAMPTYNGELFLAEQIESILAQSYKNLELIIVDDCSTDKTVEILNQYKLFKNIRIYQNGKRLGAIKNFSNAISLCNGKFIALSDQDDIWYEEKIAKLVEDIENAMLICSDVVMIDTKRKIINKSWFKYQSIYIPSKPFVFYEVVYQNFALGCTMLFKSELVKHILPIPEDSLSHDWWIAANASFLGKIKVHKDPLMFKRKHNTNVSVADRDNFIIRMKKYMLSNEREKRINRYQDSFDRIKFYLSSNMGKNESISGYLSDLIIYYDDMLKRGIHFTGVKIAFKYRKIFYGGFNPVARALQVIAKLF